MESEVLPAGTTGLQVLLDYFCAELASADPSVAVATSNPSGGSLKMMLILMMLIIKTRL